MPTQPSEVPHIMPTVTGPITRLGLDLDVRGLLALISVLGLFGIVFTQLFTGLAVTIPPEVAGTVGAAVGFYFGGKGAGGTEQVQHTQAVQSIQLADILHLVNSRLDEALAKVATPRELVARDVAAEEAEDA